MEGDPCHSNTVRPTVPAPPLTPTQLLHLSALQKEKRRLRHKTNLQMKSIRGKLEWNFFNSHANSANTAYTRTEEQHRSPLGPSGSDIDMRQVWAKLLKGVPHAHTRKWKRATKPWEEERPPRRKQQGRWEAVPGPGSWTGSSNSSSSNRWADDFAWQAWRGRLRWLQQNGAWHSSHRAQSSGWDGDYDAWVWMEGAGEEERAGGERAQQQQQRHSTHGAFSGRGVGTEPARSLRLLGLASLVGMTEQSLKDAFKRCCMEHHPDRHTDAEAKVRAEARFKEIQAAFENLKLYM